MNVLDSVDAASLRSNIPTFRTGDELKVHVRVIEGSKSRIQIFQGVVIGRRGSGLRETFTVRKISYGVGVERIFPVHAPVIEKIEIVRKGEVRRAKLYYLRDLRGKAAKIKEKRGGEDLAEVYAATPDAVPASVNEEVTEPVVEPVTEHVAEPVAEQVVVPVAVADETSENA